MTRAVPACAPCLRMRMPSGNMPGAILSRQANLAQGKEAVQLGAPALLRLKVLLQYMPLGQCGAGLTFHQHEIMAPRPMASAALDIAAPH